MRRRRTIQALLALTAVTATTSLGGTAYAGEDRPRTEQTKCDVALSGQGTSASTVTLTEDLGTG